MNDRLEDQSTVQQSRERARLIVAEAEQQAPRLRADTNTYVANQLSALENRVQRILHEVQSGQRFLAQPVDRQELRINYGLHLTGQARWPIIGGALGTARLCLATGRLATSAFLFARRSMSEAPLFNVAQLIKEPLGPTRNGKVDAFIGGLVPELMEQGASGHLCGGPPYAYDRRHPRAGRPPRKSLA